MSEQYSGVKFRTIFSGTMLPNDKRLNELVKWCHLFHDLNLAPPYPGGSFGNLSFRVRNASNSFVITGTAIGLKNNLSAEKFVFVRSCNKEEGIIYASGKNVPSSESFLHYMIYSHRPDVHTIFHGHSPEILKFCNKLSIPVTESTESYGTIQLAESVVKAISNTDFLVMRDHGFISIASDMQTAGGRALAMLEKTKY